LNIKNIKYFIIAIIQIVMLCVLLYKVQDNLSFYMLKHILAIIALLFSIGVLLYNIKWGVYVEGLMLLTGLFGFMSLHYVVTIHTHSIGIGSISIPVFYGQYSYFLMLIVHVAISFEQYYLLYKKLFSSNK
jgi:hypothetical protein